MPIEQLHQLFLKCSGVSTDTRSIQKDELFVALKGPNFNGNAYAEKAIEAGAKYVMIDEEEYFKDQSKTILVPDCLKALQELARFHRRQFTFPVFALTGSNGKTTTKELLASVLEKKYNVLATIGNLNNHIGVPLTLLRMDEDTELAIIEMGANKPGDIKELCEIAEPNYGLITTIGAAHLEGFGSLEGVRKTKTELFDWILKKEGIAFINADQQVILDEAERFDFNSKKTYGQSPFADTVGIPSESNYATVFWNQQNIESQLFGQYNFINLMAAICIGEYFRVEATDIKAALENYIPSNKRSQVVHTAKKNTILLDAYNANPSSMQLSIAAFQKMDGADKVLILGAMKELGTYADEAHQKVVDQSNVSDFNEVYFVGDEYKSTSAKKVFKDTFDLLERIETATWKNRTILLKGSRSIALEKLLEHL